MAPHRFGGLCAVCAPEPLIRMPPPPAGPARSESTTLRHGGCRGLSRDTRPRVIVLLCPEMADRPITDLPDEVTLTRDEAAVVLFALDVVDSAVSEPEEAEKVRRAVRLLTRKLWPELGDLLDDEGEE